MKSWKAPFGSEDEDQLVSNTPTHELDMTTDVQVAGKKVLGSVVRDQLVSSTPAHDMEMTTDVPNVGKKGSGALVMGQVVSNAPAYDMDKTTVVPIVGKECSDEEVEAPLVTDAPAHEMDMTTVVPIVGKECSDEEIEAPLVTDAPAHEMDMTTVVTTVRKNGSDAVVENQVVSNAPALVKVNNVLVHHNSKEIYSIVNKLSGFMGLNAEFGPIYGENRIGSFQAVVKKMKAYTDLNDKSYFINVGCVRGKPNLHVAQDPGVAISIGMEVVENRLDVCLKHFFAVLQRAKNQQNEEISPVNRLGYNCYFLKMDVTEAASFDPFTHP